MPIYEYHCLACGRAFEKLVLGKAATAIACPGCAGRDVARTPSVFGVRNAAESVTGARRGAAAGGCCGPGGCGCR